jgi:hypothetical protein
MFLGRAFGAKVRKAGGLKPANAPYFQNTLVEANDIWIQRLALMQSITSEHA